MSKIDTHYTLIIHAQYTEACYIVLYIFLRLVRGTCDVCEKLQGCYLAVEPMTLHAIASPTT